MTDRKTILIVEDNPLNLKLAADLLEFNGYNVLKAEDGETALEILANEIPDLVLLDIQLPGIDGFGVFEKIKADSRLGNTKVSAMTAQAMTEEVEAMKNAGFEHIILKPIDIKNFIQTIADILS